MSTSHLRAAALAIAVAVVTTLLASCATQNYYLPRPESADDTLLVIRATTVTDPAVEYVLVLDTGERIRVFPVYPLTFVRGLAPGVHRAVRVLAGSAGGSRTTASVEAPAEFVMEAGGITVFPFVFAVGRERVQRRSNLMVVTQRCTFPQITDPDLVEIQQLFDQRRRSETWDGFKIAPLGTSGVPESTMLLWQDVSIIPRNTRE